MGALADRIASRIPELEQQLDTIQARADREKTAVQQEITVLTNALAVLTATPGAEVVMLQLIALKLLPKE